MLNLKKISIIFLLSIFFIPLSVFAIDSDSDGIDDSIDVCPNTNPLYVNDIHTSGDRIGCFTDPETDFWDNLEVGNNPDTSDNINSETKNGTNKNNNALDDLGSSNFVKVSKGGSKGIYNSIIKIAFNLKNLFLVIASIYLLVLVFRIFFTNGTEEEVGKFKKGILWTTVGIIVMQTAYSFITILFDRGVNQSVAFNFTKEIVYPFIDLLTLLVSFFFIAIAIFTYFRIVTAGGDEEKIKKGKTSIVQAIIGFIVIRISSLIVDATYGKINCNTDGGFFSITGQNCIETPKIEGNIGIIITLINWFNNFIGIVTIIMIIYAGSMIMLSGGDEEKIKKGKQAMLYVGIGLLLLASSYLILTFFILPEAQF